MTSCRPPSSQWGNQLLFLTDAVRLPSSFFTANPSPSLSVGCPLRPSCGKRNESEKCVPLLGAARSGGLQQLLIAASVVWLSIDFFFKSTAVVWCNQRSPDHRETPKTPTFLGGILQIHLTIIKHNFPEGAGMYLKWKRRIRSLWRQ